MDSAVLTIAKGMLDYDSKELDKIFDVCEDKALVLLSKLVPIDVLSNYLTTISLTYTKAELGKDARYTKLTVNDINGFKIGDMITIPNDIGLTKHYAGNFVVLDLDTELFTIEIYRAFVDTETGTITNNSHQAVTYAHAYLILHTLVISSQSIVKGDVIYSSQQFGQGTLAPSSMSEKKLLADRYMNEAMRLVGSFRGLVV